MEIVFDPPRFILWIVIGIAVVAVPSILLKKGSRNLKVVGLVVLAGVVTVLIVFLYRPTRLSVTDQGLYTDTSGGKVTVPWAEMREVRLVRSFEQTEYKPVLRTNGVGLPGFRAGWFKLANGQTARLVAQRSADALIVATDKITYLLAPDRFEELVAKVRRHVSIIEEE